MRANALIEQPLLELESRPKPWHHSLSVRARTSPTWIAVSLPVLLTFVTGWLDHITGWEVSLFIFYSIPIALAVWWSGVMAGCFVAVLSGVVWWLANSTTHPYETTLGYAWALFNREFYFFIVVFAVNAVRIQQKSDAAHIQMLEERRQLEKDIVKVSEHEQQRIGQDLHDGLCQQLAAIGCAVRVLADDLESQQQPTAQDASLIEESIRQTMMDTRDLARGIFPVHVDRAGLSAALTDLANNTSKLTGVTIVVKETSEVQIDNPEAAMHLYRIVQEAVANAVRHSYAQNITITLRPSRSELKLRVEDDGTGMDGGTVSRSEGMGLRTMRYRAQTVGATLEISPRIAGGTCVTCRLPLPIQPADDHAQV